MTEGNRRVYIDLSCLSASIVFLSLPSPSMRPAPWASIPLSLLALVLGVLAQNEGSPQDYAPNVNQTCPDVATAPLVRVFSPANQTLHPEEQAYVDDRLANVIPAAWTDWLGDGSAIGYNLSTFTNNTAKIGIAISGGGYRAAQYGAGVLSALDARNDSAKHAGTGGLLQVASYLSGLSGECEHPEPVSGYPHSDTDTNAVSSQAGRGSRARCTSTTGRPSRISCLELRPPRGGSSTSTSPRPMGSISSATRTSTFSGVCCGVSSQRRTNGCKRRFVPMAIVAATGHSTVIEPLVADTRVHAFQRHELDGSLGAHDILPLPQPDDARQLLHERYRPRRRAAVVTYPTRTGLAAAPGAVPARHGRLAPRWLRFDGAPRA